MKTGLKVVVGLVVGTGVLAAPNHFRKGKVGERSGTLATIAGNVHAGSSRDVRLFVAATPA